LAAQYSDDLDPILSPAVHDQIPADRPEPDIVTLWYQITSPVPETGSPAQHVARGKQPRYQAVGGIRISLGDVVCNLDQIQAGSSG